MDRSNFGFVAVDDNGSNFGDVDTVGDFGIKRSSGLMTLWSVVGDDLGLISMASSMALGTMTNMLKG